jgi:hypothetical protein
MGEQLVVVGVDGSTASYTALRFCRTPGAPARPCMQCAAVRRCWRKAGKRRSLPSRCHHSARHPDTSSCDRPLLTAIHFRSSNPMQEASIILLSLGPWSSMLYQVNPWMDAMPSDVGERSIISGL